MASSLTTKFCCKCGNDLPAEDFYLSRMNRDGLHSWCKPCARAYAAERRTIVDRDSVRQQRAAYRAANAERIRQANAEQYRKNRLRRIAEAAQYRKENAESIRLADQLKREAFRVEKARREADFRARFPELVARQEREQRERSLILARLRSSRRRAREKSAPVYAVSPKDRRRLISSGCAVAGCDKTDIHIDHIIPVVRGGGHGIGNLQTLCSFHNMSKGPKTWMEFRVYLRSQ